MGSRTLGWLITLIVWGSCASLAFAGQPRIAGDVGWVGLFSNELISWLENENRLEHLCGDAEPASVKWQLCRGQKMAPKVVTIRLFSGPNERTRSAGSLAIVATPGRGLTVSFTSTDGGTAIPFRPDLFEGDWGYGPYFHQTFLARRGSWFLLPARPFRRAAWFNAEDLGKEPQVRLLEVGEIVTSGHGDLVILAIGSGIVRARREQDADMWCDRNPPPLKPFKELRLPVRQLYDPMGHLLLHVKYTRGC